MVARGELSRPILIFECLYVEALNTVYSSEDFSCNYAEEAFYFYTNISRYLDMLYNPRLVNSPQTNV